MKRDEIYFWFLFLISVVAFVYAALTMPAGALV
jgi:hypothetical protein